MTRCDECGFGYDDLARDAITLGIRATAAEYRPRLVPENADDVAHTLRLRSRPITGVWSALEYACHVRDVLAVQRERVQLAQVEDRPEVTPMGREERVERDRYNEQSPETVADELTGAADRLAADLDALDDDGWTRTVLYNWPTREERTVEWIAIHTVHELVHHRQDLDDVLRAAS